MSSSPVVDNTYAAAVRASVSHAILAAAASAGGRPKPFSNPRTASEVFPRIYIADVFTACKTDALRSLAITHVVSALDHPITFPTELSLQTLRVPIHDFPMEDLLSHLPGAVQFIATALQDPQARVLVHCWQGVSRSSSIVAAYLVAIQRMPPSEAVSLMQAKRPIVQPNPGFLRQLRQYEVLVRAEEAIALEDSTK